MRDEAIEIDALNPVSELTPAEIDRLADRVAGSWTSEQLIYREAELDDLWRHVETAIKGNRRIGRNDATVTVLDRVYRLTEEAHDLVGRDSDVLGAATRLRTAAATLAASPARP